MANDQAGARWSVAPYFKVSDVVVAANFYRDQLGFAYQRLWGEPPNFCMVHRNGVILMLAQAAENGRANPNGSAEQEHWDAYIWVNDADALISEYRHKSVRILRDICDQPYGCRDFDVEDCDGYRLCFGHTLERTG